MFTSSLYSKFPSVVLGFHGCERNIGEKVLRGEEKHLNFSENSYDWLGSGIYFWENSPSRALEFAKNVKKIQEPFIVGAIIDLGNCLDLMDYENIQFLKESYNDLEVDLNKSQLTIPQNIRPKGGKDLLLRHLDCAVIENLHRINETKKICSPFDSAKGLFIEGQEVYPNAGFHEKNHIQICVRNTACIKGYFRPL